MNLHFRSETMNCSECDKPFEAKIFKSTNKPLSPLCYECRAKHREILDKAEKDAAEAQIKELRDNWLKRSGIPHKFLNESLNTFQDRGANTADILFQCQEYAKNFPAISAVSYRSFILVSPRRWGVGKSHLACGIGKYVIEKWLSWKEISPVYYATEQDMLRRVRSTFNRDNGETEEQVFAHLTNVPLLIIDDMGKEEVSDPRFVQRFWFSLVNGRYENELPMVITSNLNPDEIATYLGGGRGNEATFDRIYEMVKGEMLEIEGQSKRRGL